MSKKDVDELTKCFNCQSIINVPKILPCGYSICLKCCQSFKTINCIYCKSSHNLSKNLITNQAHLRLLNLLNVTEQSYDYVFMEEIKKQENKVYNTTKIYQEEVQDDNNHQIINLNTDQTLENVNMEIFKNIKQLNNEFHQIKINFNKYIQQNTLQKSVKILANNKVLLIQESLYGKVWSTNLKLINYDGELVNEKELSNDFMNIFENCVYDQNILITFRKGRNHFYSYLYDSSFNLVKEKITDYEITKILMNESKICFLSEDKPCVHEYDYNFLKVGKYGQLSNEKKKFYLKGDIFSIQSDKIHLKLDNEIRIISRVSGELLTKFNLIDLKTSKVFFDGKQNYLLFNGYTRFSLYNQSGQLIVSNKLRCYEKYDEFQLSNHGIFAFINYSNKLILII